MAKIIKESVYREVLECENCGQRWSMNERYPEYKAGICTCWVCKKEGCKKCSAWMNPTGKKYSYHFNCKKGLPKAVLKAMKEQDDEYDRQQRWSKYVNG